jgi:hypothetical protein
MSKAKVKMKGDRGAILCSHCSVAIKESHSWNQDEWSYARTGKPKIKALYCDECSYQRNKNKS